MLEALRPMHETFKRIQPSFVGPIKPPQSISMQLAILDKLTADDNGKFISHLGNDKEWL